MLQESEYEGLFNLLKTSPSLSPPPSESSVHDAADLSQLKRGLLMECVLSNMAWGLELEHHEERQRTTKETSTRSRDTHDATIDPELSNIFKTAAMKESSLSICSAYSKDGNINAFSHCKHAANVCSSDFLSKKDRGIGFKQCLNLAITAPTPEFPLSMASAEETQVAVELLTDHFHRGMSEIESVIKRKVPGFRGKTGKEWSERQRQRVEEGDLPVVLNSASPSTLYNARLGLLTENEIDCLEAGKSNLGIWNMFILVQR